MAGLVDLPRYFRAWRKRGLIATIIQHCRVRTKPRPKQPQSADRPERIPEGGTRTKMAYGGLFKEATLTQGRQMEKASETS